MSSIACSYVFLPTRVLPKLRSQVKDIIGNRECIFVTVRFQRIGLACHRPGEGDAETGVPVFIEAPEIAPAQAAMQQLFSPFLKDDQERGVGSGGRLIGVSARLI